MFELPKIVSPKVVVHPGMHFWSLLRTVLFAFVFMTTVFTAGLLRTATGEAEIVGFVNARKQVAYVFVFDLDF